MSWPKSTRIRRYGAHGTSHRFVAQEMIKLLGKPAAETKIVTCHIGNGSSISAVRGGRCFDTSMGFTTAGRRHDGHPLRRHRPRDSDVSDA